MQNLRLFVSEGNMIKGYVGVRKDSSLGRPHKLRLIQKIPYLFYGGIHHGQAVGVLQCLNQWFYESKGVISVPASTLPFIKSQLPKGSTPTSVAVRMESPIT